MTIRRPGVEREQCAQHSKSNEKEGKEKFLDLNRNMNLGNRKKAEGQLATVRVGIEIQSQQSHQDQCRTTHQHQGQLHGRIFPRTAPPDTDQKVHRDDCNLVKQEQGKQVEGDEKAKYPGREKDQGDKKFFGQLFHFPGGKDPGKDDDGR